MGYNFYFRCCVIVLFGWLKKKVWRCDYYFIIGILVCVWKVKYMVKLEKII